jgi:signal transduction histidine kinase
MADHLSGRQSVAVSRLPDPVEIAAYYTVSEALTNAAKHARATAVDVQVAVSDRVLHLRIRDNGRSGANFTHGTGLIGLKDRAEALGGHLELRSPQGAGTTLDITLPLGEPGWPGPPPEAAGTPE